MKQSFKNYLALCTANKLSTRARGLRRELRDHYRQEFARIRLAERRARGLRLYAAWSCPQDMVPDKESARQWQPAISAA